jgi:hypothetical protein
LKLAEIGPSCKPVWRILFLLLHRTLELEEELVLLRRLSCAMEGRLAPFVEIGNTKTERIRHGD